MPAKRAGAPGLVADDEGSEVVEVPEMVPPAAIPLPPVMREISSRFRWDEATRFDTRLTADSKDFAPCAFARERAS